MKAKGLFAGIGIALLVLGCARPSAAQATPGVFADANHPAGAPDPEKLDQIWQVDPLTGSVSITIPFTTTPAGGRGPKIPFSLHYNSASTVTLQPLGSTIIYNPSYDSLAGVPANEIIQFFAWATGNLNAFPPGPVGPWTTSGPFFYDNTAIIQSATYEYQIGGDPVVTNTYQGCTINGPYIYTDASGVAHDMNLLTTNLSQNTTAFPANSQPQCTMAYSQMTSNSSTTDGSALVTAAGTWSNIAQPDGTNVTKSASGATLEDSNGNTASLGFNTTLNEYVATDSLGRQAFSTTLPIGAPGMIGVGNYNVTTTGATGSSETYTVNVGTATLGSFTMPHPVGGPIPTAEIMSSQNICIQSESCPTSYGVYQPPYSGAYGGSTLNVVNSITLPDSTSYTFTYDPTYGTISKIVFPTGGYVRFVWAIRGDGGGYGQFELRSTIVVSEVCTSTGSGAENCWQYNFPSYSSTTGLTSTVIAPDDSYTVYTGTAILYSGLSMFTQGEAPTWKEASRLEYSSSGTLMKSVATTYIMVGPDTGLPSQVATTLYDGPTYLQQYAQYGYDGYTNVVEKDESDFNQCTGSPCPMPTIPPSFLRKTFTSYAYASNSTMAGAHIVDKPSQVLVTDGSGNPASLTTYTYDQPSNIGVCPSGYCTTGLTNHDTAYDGNISIPRGNLTMESRCISGINATFSSGVFSSATCGSSWNTNYYYDWTGQLTQKIEGGTGPSSPATTIYIWSGPNGTNDGYNGFLTMVQHPDGTKDQYTYWQPIGAVATHSDVNNQTTIYSYESYLNRIASIVLPPTVDGTTGSSGNGGTIYTYTDTLGAFSVQEQHPINTTGTPTSVTKTYDGLGRAIQTAMLVPTTQCSGGTLFTQTTYDSMSRVYSVSNPFCSTSDPTYGLTYYAYDGLGRKIRTTLTDGAISTITYAGNATKTTDPPNGTTSVQHIQQINGLGFLTNVCEVGLAPLATGGPQSCGLNIAGSGSLTTYTYNPLGNMLGVNQHGLSRTFSYDSLSRLASALNPEVGTDTYTYSNSSNACSPSAGVPCTRTDARGVITTYAYDSMSRLTSKSYSTAATNTTGTISDLSSCYKYGVSQDQTNNTGGRLIAEWMQAGTCASSAPSTAVGVRYHPIYDAMGRLLLDQQCLTGASCSATTGNFIYTYNLLGNPVQSNNGIAPPTPVGATLMVTQNTTPITAPSITWKTYYDIADHISLVGIQDQPSTSVFPAATYSFAPTLLNPTSYDPFGHLTGAQLGISNGSSTAAINILRQYDNRGRIMNETDGGLLDTSAASGSIGLITVGGAEKARYSTNATPGTATITVSGSDSTHEVCTTITNQYTSYQTCNYVYDNGTVAITINGFTSSAPYSGNVADGTLAATLAAGFNVSGSPVTAAIVNGSSIIVTAVATGPSSNYPVALTFNSSDYTLSGASATLAGGHRGGCLAYDTGTVTARINNASGFTPFSYAASANWAQNDTAATVAARLASSINAAAGSVVTATPNTANASSINLYSNATGAAADFNISVSVTDGMGMLYPYLLANPSFSLDAESMSGGAGADTSYGTIYSYVAGYAPNGNILTHSDSVMGNWNFSYDSQDRLATAATGANVPSVFQGQSASWSYDSYGNRTAQSFSNGVYSNWATYNPANNRITAATSAVAGYVYDASGNTLYDGNNEYWYDAEGQLCAVQSLAIPGLPITQYVYDAEGARIAKGTLSAAPASSTATCAPPLSSGFTLTTRYLVDQGGDQVTELSEQGLPTPATEVWKHSNVFSAARLTATYDTSGLHYELADPLGTKRVQANIYGQIEMSWASLPFGDALTPIPPPNPPPTADDATEHHFTQKERDNESGNDYFFARYYNSAIGRFTTPDWSAKTDPVPYAIFTDPQSLNLYAYVRNNPLTSVDLDGHCWGGGWCDLHGTPYQTDSQIKAAMQAAQQTQISTVQAKRDELAKTAKAQADARSTKWAYAAPPCKGFKCSVFVHDMLALVGIGVNSGYKSGEGPVAADLANQKYHMAGWTNAQYKGPVAPGSIVAYAAGYTDATGDSAIVTRIVKGVPYVVHAGRELVYEEPITRWAQRDYQNPGGYYARTYVGP